MEDKKIIRSLLALLSQILTTGWLICGLVKHDWILVFAVLSACFGMAITFALKEIKNKKNE